MPNWVKSFALGALALLVWALFQAVFGAATLLPNGESCFQTAAGPVSSGSVYMLVPNTTTPKDTWKDAAQTILNSNPIPLDANGCAIIYGAGQYQQQLYSGPVVGGLPTGSLIYNLPTADTSFGNPITYVGFVGGTPNALATTITGFPFNDGSIINFEAQSANTGPVTLNVLGNTAGEGAVPILINGIGGQSPVPAGCFQIFSVVSVLFSADSQNFRLLTPCVAGSNASIAATPPPGGYLTLLNDGSQIIQTGDISAATVVYYWPYVNNQVPIWNGSAFILYSFSTGKTLNLTGSQSGSTIYDVCIFLNSGAPTLVTGPAWSSSTAGSSSRGTGAGTPQLQKLNGIWVNAVQITGLNGGSSFTIAANQCTYLGSIFTDSSAGQVSSFVSWGQSRKNGVWNAYNRQRVELQIGDSTTSWTNTSGTIRLSNNNAANSASVLTGLAEEWVTAIFNQTGAASTGASITIRNGVGVNNTTFFSGQAGIIGLNPSGASTVTGTMGATLVSTPLLGVNTYNELESGATGGWFSGTQTNMQMTLGLRG